MGFTRSTTTTNVHSTLGDYPAEDDHLSSEQLKARFDSPATGLKSDLNGLMGELEASTSAASIGAANITYDDASDGNVQAKLEKIYSDLQAAAIGEIPDNTITEAKLASTYSTTVAKKDGTTQTNLNADQLDGYHASSFGLKNGNVQTNLNAEKLGGSTLAQVMARASSYFTTGTVTITKNSSYQTSGTLSLGYTPSLVVLVQFPGTSGTKVYETCLAIILGTKLLYYVPENDKYCSIDVTLNNGVITIPYNASGLDAGTYNFIAFKSSL